MVGGGLIALTSYGTQNVLLSGNPDFTYFYKMYKKYSHFSQENYTYSLDGPNELLYDQEITVRTNIQRISSLVSDLYFSFRLPDIYCKDVGVERGGQQYNFQWVKMIGARIIRQAGIYIGGNKIQEIDADYIMAKALADYSVDTLGKWKRLVGDIPELTDPANGSQPGNNTPGVYPIVIKDPEESGPQTNRPSIPGYTVHVPIPFWFTQGISQSIPIVGLQYHPVELKLTLAPIRDLYTILDESGNRVRPGFHTKTNGQYEPSDDQNYFINNFLVDFNNTNPTSYSWSLLNPSIDVTYTYVTSEEEKVFATQPLSYLIYQPFTTLFDNINGLQLLEIKYQNPLARLMFLPRRSDSADYRNDWTNLTNWVNYQKSPYKTFSGDTSGTSSGKLMSGSQKEIIRAIRILANGNEIQQQKSYEYFENIVPWKCLEGSPKNMPVFSFQLNHPSLQPSGAINLSRIRLFQIELDIFPLPVNFTYTYDIVVVLETINWFIVESGYGGLKYNI